MTFRKAVSQPLAEPIPDDMTALLGKLDMSWNYRVIDRSGVLSVCEVYYSPAGEIIASCGPTEIIGDTIDEIEEDLRFILAELRKRPIVPESDLPL